MKIDNNIGAAFLNRDIQINKDQNSKEIKNDKVSLRDQNINIQKKVLLQGETVSDQISFLKDKLSQIKYNVNYDFSKYLLMDTVQASEKLRNLKESILVDLNKEVNKTSVVNNKTINILNNLSKEIINAK